MESDKMTFSNFAICGYHDPASPPALSGSISGFLYWHEGLANWVELTEVPPSVPYGAPFRLAVGWVNQSSEAICGHVELTITAPDGASITLDALENQNRWAPPGNGWIVQFQPLILDKGGIYTARVALSALGEALDEKTLDVAKVLTLQLSFTNPHYSRTWAWKPRLYDINTQSWQSAPTTYNDPAAAVEFLPTGNFLLYVSEYWRDIDGTMFTSRYGPYLIEVPVLLRGDYTWDGANAKLSGEYIISGGDITGSENSCGVTGVVSNVDVEGGNVEANFALEEINSIRGLGAAQFFLGRTLLDVTIHHALDEDDKKIIYDGDRIVMSLYLLGKFKWHATSPHYPLEYPAEYYRFSGSAVEVRHDWYKRWYAITVSSPYLSQFGIVILQWDRTQDETDKFTRLVGPVANYEYVISRDHFIYVLAHPNPDNPFNDRWCREQWYLNNWQVVVKEFATGH